jgi:carbamate kinase
MLVVIALGGNALLKRGDPLTAENQRSSVKTAARAIAEIVNAGHRVVVTHGNGPQVGLLALQNYAYKPDEAYPLDLLGAETEGMIGYLIEQALESELPKDMRVATLLTQVEVDAHDDAFNHPVKPIGPVYSADEADKLASSRGWVMAADGDSYRRVVASPRPRRITDIGIIRLLIEHGVTVICAGGGGIPVVAREDGSLLGVEAVIDKDFSSALLATELGADALLMLTDVDGVYRNWQREDQTRISRATPRQVTGLDLPEGSMAPKVKAACEFVTATGGLAGIGRLADALRIIQGTAGTVISN